MAVELKIASGGLFKKKTTFAEMAKGFSYGITNENYCLEMDKQGINTVLYDSRRIGRGIELSLLNEGSTVCLRLSLPAGGQEITEFYHLAEHACSILNTKQYLRDEEKVTHSDSARFIELDQQASLSALQDIFDKISKGDYKYYFIFGARIPLTIGEEDIHSFYNDLDCLEDWLNERQQLDAYYANPRVYQKKDGTLFGVYFISADVRSILPTEPYIIMNQIKNIQEWYVMMGKDSVTVPFHDFIRSAAGERFDANHIVVTLTQQELDAIGQQHSVGL